MDNLTVDWLRTRLLELESSVKDCQERQLKMIEHVNGGSPVANGSIISNGSNTSNGIQSNKDSHRYVRNCSMYYIPLLYYLPKPADNRRI